MSGNLENGEVISIFERNVTNYFEQKMKMESKSKLKEHRAH